MADKDPGYGPADDEKTRAANDAQLRSFHDYWTKQPDSPERKSYMKEVAPKVNARFKAAGQPLLGKSAAKPAAKATAAKKTTAAKTTTKPAAKPAAKPVAKKAAPKKAAK